MEPAPPPPADPSGPLDNPTFRSLWTANAVSNFGGQIQVVAAAWLMATLTTSPQLIALVQTAQSLPTVCFILLGGAIADNFERRRIMTVTQSAMLFFALVLALLSWSEGITPWLLLALIFATQSFNALNNPSWQASVRELLPRSLISRAVALNSMSINLARTAGPALGGAIVSVAGVAVAFMFNAASFIGFLVALLRWKPEATERTSPREAIAPAVIAGVRYAAYDANVRNAVLRGGMSGLSASAVFALLPVLARQELDASAFVYGLLLASFGGGAVIFAYMAGHLRSRFTPDVVTRSAAASITLGLVLLGFATNVPLAALGAAFGGAGWTMAHSTYNTTVQLSAAPWVTARSLAFYQTATFAGMAGGSALFGWVAGAWDVYTAFLAAAAAQALAAVIGLLLPLPRLEDLKVEPLAFWQPPKLEVEMQQSDGPIRVEIEYRVVEADWPAFNAAMQTRRRIRNRDGARNWMLWQDVTDRTRWVESYRVANWADYLRHNQRRTEADKVNMDELSRLSTEADGPRVRRYLGRS